MRVDFRQETRNGLRMTTRNILITGANAGIGKATAIALSKEPNVRLFLACRSEAATQDVLRELDKKTPAEWLPLDLSDLGSVRKCAELFRSKNVPLHILINNAGLAGKKGLTKDGFELMFGVNHLGHFLLTQSLLDLLEGTSDEPARIVNVSSGSHYQAKKVVWDDLRSPAKTYTGMEAYEISKLCNVLYTKSLAKRFVGKNVRVYSLHPGTVASNVWREIPWPVGAIMKRFMKSNEEGATASLHCALSEKAKNETGLFYWDDAKVREPNKLALDENLQEELWQRSVAWTHAPNAS